MPISLKPKPNIIGKNSMTSISVAPSQLSIQESAQTTRPEIELLLCCARTQPSSEISQQIQSLVQQSIDWDFLLQTAARHSVLPLLYQNLKTLCPEAVPKPVLSELRNLFHTNAAHNLFLTQELLKIIKLFQDNDIPVISFKGPVLALSAYGNLALREFGDLDILVHEQDVPKVTDLLISQGYRLPAQLADVQEKPYLQYPQFFDSAQHKGSFIFSHSQRNVVLDIHWSLTPKDFSFPVDLKQWWDNTQSVSLVGRIVSTFSPENLLPYLCMHGTKHCWVLLRWVVDIAELLRVHQGIDWEQVTEQSHNLHTERMLWLGLLLASELLGTTLPEQVLLRIQADNTAKALSQQVCDHLFDDPITGLEKYFFIVKARERLLDKVWYFLSLIVTPTSKEWEFFPLPESLSFLYYLIRPMRLFIKQLKGG